MDAPSAIGIEGVLRQVRGGAFLEYRLDMLQGIERSCVHQSHLR